MPGPDKKISLRLSGGMTNRQLPEFVDPAPIQGSEPKLVTSTNTRLSKVPGGVARSPKATLLANTGATRRYGFVPAAAAKKTQLTAGLRFSFNFDVMGDGSSEPFVAGAAASASGLPYVMGSIVDAGEFDGLACASQVAQVYEASTGLIYRAVLVWVPDFLGAALGYGTWAVYVSTTYPDGRQFSPMSLIGSPYQGRATQMPWLGLTSHPTAGVWVWTLRNEAEGRYGTGLTGVYCQRVVLNNFTNVAFTGPIFVTNPIDQTVTPDLISAGDTAYLLCGSSTIGADTEILQYAVSSDGLANSVVTRVRLPNTVSGKTRCALHRVVMAGGETAIYSAVSRETASKVSIARWSDALANLGAAIDVDMGIFTPTVVTIKRTTASVDVFVGFVRGNATELAAAQVDGEIVGTSRVLVPLPSQPWTKFGEPLDFSYLLPHSHGVEWTDSAGTVHAIMFFVRRYGRSNLLPGHVDYADDPAIVAYDMTSFGNPVPVAWFACVRGVSNPVQAYYNDDFASRSDIVVGDQIFCGWRKIHNYTTAPYSGIGRYTCIDMTPRHVPVAHDRDGDALVACAAPAVYDGGRVIEMGGMRFSPHISIFGAVSKVAPTASYSFVAYYEYPDASGCTHRSRPSNIVTVTANTATTITVLCTSAPINLPYESRSRFLVYATEANGTTFHLVHMGPMNRTGYGFAVIQPAQIDGGAPQIYSTGSAGEELTPQPAPPLRDIAIVGQRAMGIDAEFPTRIVYSKLRVAGIGYEWFPAGEFSLPSEAGQAMAVREWQGVAVIFAQRGVYQVAGDGPNNSASAGAFAPPVKISDIGCSNTASVVEYPGGIMWQSGSRFARLSGGVAFDNDMNCTHDVSAAVCMPRYDEVLFFSDAIAEVRVFNYALGRWTIWDSETLPDRVTMARVLPWDEDKVLVYSDSAKTIRRIDADSVSSAAHMTFETDWILADGDFQSHILVREVIFSGAIVGPHALELSVFLDYEATPSTVETWAADVLSDNAVNGRYTVRKELLKDSCRAYKIRIRDSVAANEVNSGGVSPRAVTVIFAVDGAIYEEVFNAEMRR